MLFEGNELKFVFQDGLGTLPAALKAWLFLGITGMKL